MALPRSAKAVIALAIGGGVATSAAGISLSRTSGVGSPAPLAFFTAAVIASWLWPLVMYRGAESEAVHLDEGFFVVMALVLPPGGVILAFAAATLVAQALRGRALVKSAFNSGQMLTAVGLGLAVAHVAERRGHTITPLVLVEAAAGAVVFFAVNNGFLAAILTGTGASTPRRALLDGMEIRLLLLGVSVIPGLVAALAISAHPWALVLAGLPFAAFRQVLAGHFRARHDRTRMVGLFNATLDAHRSMGAAEVTDAVKGAARNLLRCPTAELAGVEPMLGWTEAELGQATLSDLGLASPVEFLTAPALRSMRTRTTVRSDDTMFRRRDATAFPVDLTCSPVIDDGHVAGAVAVFRDITERKAFEERLAHHAFHDHLTGLPNRRVFLDRLEQALRRSQRNGAIHGVLFADVDRFKVINDSVGHQAGDRLPMAIAEHISESLRPGDTLARFGGDEFTVLLEDIGDVKDGEAVAQRVLAALRIPIPLLGGHEVVASISVGITVATPGVSADDVLHDADVAMYQAKAGGAG